MSCALRVVMGGHCVAFIVLRICKSFGISIYSLVMKKSMRSTATVRK